MAHEEPGGTVKIIELVGSSPSSFSDAVRNAVKTASKTIRNIKGVEVYSSTATVGDTGDITNYKVQVKIAFLIEEGASAG
ncbi:MAG TPA: dodecin family protein [Actinomycetota bacterium]|nr:dodecin family protein [Actinomycetota bacterium]